MVNTEMAQQARKLFKEYRIANEITEDGEFYGLVKGMRDKPIGSNVKDAVCIAPFLIENSKYIFYENVFIFFDEVNQPWSSAGKFLQLFEDARHWGDALDRIIGIEVKLNRSQNGKVYKNVVDVFLTDADDLVFDDEHIVACGGVAVKTRTTSKSNSGTGKNNTTSKSKMQLILEDDDED